jgi:hypothetical protein
MLKLFSPAGVEPASKKVIPAINNPAVAVDAKNFTELLPLLKDIETLILVGDGTGRGKLPYSRYEAEPAELDLDIRPVRGIQDRLDSKETPRSSRPVRRDSATLTRSVSEGCRKCLALPRPTLPFGGCPPRSRFGLVRATAHQPRCRIGACRLSWWC